MAVPPETGKSKECKTSVRDGVHVISLPETLDTDEMKLEAAVTLWLTSTPDVHVLDFKDVTKLKTNTYRHLLHFGQMLKKNKKRLFCININTEVAKQIKQDGLVGGFIEIPSLEEAQKRAKPQKSMLDVDIINPFVEGTLKVLETQAKIKLTPGKLHLRNPDDQSQIEIAGVLALSCAEFTGSIALCFSAKVFLKVYERPSRRNARRDRRRKSGRSRRNSQYDLRPREDSVE